MSYSMKCYAKLNNELYMWHAIASSPNEAIELVRIQIADPKARVLCSIDMSEERTDQHIKEPA